MTATPTGGAGSKEGLSDPVVVSGNAIASERVTEAPQGSLRLDGNQPLSVKAEGSLTATPTGGAGAKAGLSDPVV